VLKSDRGPLLLSGNGRWSGRALRFDGQASATPEYREQLADLLSILGKPQGDSYLLHFGTP
jgi:general secretion pathway protein N